MTSRHRSNPSSDPYARDLPSILTPASSFAHTPAEGSRLLSQADALARMTLELNLRQVGLQANRLEEDIKALVQCTGEDRRFRAEHEGRLNEIWHEILAVKARMADVNGGQETLGTVREDVERCQYETERCRRETARMIEHFKQEMAGFREMCYGLATQLDQLQEAAETQGYITPAQSQDVAALERKTCKLPPVADVKPALIPASSQESKAPGTSTEPTPHHRQTAHEPQQAQSPSNKRNTRSTAQQAAKKRIKEALGSTRRWNHDHKTTNLKDSVFVANYLKQQSKRDPAMAVLIQRALRKRVCRRRPHSKSPPETLEDFCKDVRWRDVIATVEEELIKAESEAVKALR
ncbi:hypothetical protein S40293_08983 [Stachybotrys chartarum IBT 40293]|nr:hypothetical protein S40293_08983 [Stachybotrys chartarum IBT 40293]KFA78132.1 hypothetical protein S40288_01406 [Stachybotrys chartarum IBT 40288]